MDCEKHCKNASQVTGKSRGKSSKNGIQIFQIISVITILTQTIKALPQPPAELFKMKQNKIINPTNKPEQNILFEEVGKLATQMKYVHVLIPLNITTFFTQAQILQDSFQNLTSQTTADKRRVSFTKAIRDAGTYGMRKLTTIMDQIKNLDNNLPHNDTTQHRQHKQDTHVRLKRDVACALSYGFEQKQCGPNIDPPVIDDVSTHPTKTDSHLHTKDTGFQWELIEKKIKLKRVFDQLHAKDKQYLERQLHPVNMNLPQ